MWRPDRSVRGPDRPTLRDIDSLNRVFADAFTDRYSRDGLVGVRVPQLNTLVWRYALEDAGDGAMIWRDADGPDRGLQHGAPLRHRGLDGTARGAARPPGRGPRVRDGARSASTGSRAGRHAPSASRPCRGRSTTSASTAGIGLVPGPLTVTLVHDVPAPGRRRAELLSLRRAGARPRLEECRQLTDQLAAGRGLHPRDRADARPRHRRHDAGARRRRADRVCALALHAARRRARRKTSCGCSSSSPQRPRGIRPAARGPSGHGGRRSGSAASRSAARPNYADAYLRLIAAVSGPLDRSPDDPARLPAAPPRRGRRDVQLGDLSRLRKVDPLQLLTIRTAFLSLCARGITEKRWRSSGGHSLALGNTPVVPAHHPSPSQSSGPDPSRPRSRGDSGAPARQDLLTTSHRCGHAARRRVAWCARPPPNLDRDLSTMIRARTICRSLSRRPLARDARDGWPDLPATTPSPRGAGRAPSATTTTPHPAIPRPRSTRSVPPWRM